MRGTQKLPVSNFICLVNFSLFASYVESGDRERQRFIWYLITITTTTIICKFESVNPFHSPRSLSLPSISETSFNNLVLSTMTQLPENMSTPQTPTAFKIAAKFRHIQPLRPWTERLSPCAAIYRIPLDTRGPHPGPCLLNVEASLTEDQQKATKLKGLR